MPTYFHPHHVRSVAVARQIIEEVDDTMWCRENGNDSDHIVCCHNPAAASWPEPNPLHDLEWDEF